MNPAINYIDGSPMFPDAVDKRNEAIVAEQCAQAWNCEMHSFGLLAPIDFYALRDGRIVGLAEVKARTCSSDNYPTVYLSVKKWLALQLGAIGLGVPALYVVKFTDQILWIKSNNVDATRLRMAGRHDRNRRTDIEPMIEVPIYEMVPL